jgi:hypothetical protein
MSSTNTSNSSPHIIEAYISCMHSLGETVNVTPATTTTTTTSTAAAVAAVADEVVERRDDLLHLGVALLAAFTYVPLSLGLKSLAQKFQTSMRISTRLVANVSFMRLWLAYLAHPSSCINVLKALYSMCMCSREVCLCIAANKEAVNALCDILSEKVFCLKSKI